MSEKLIRLAVYGTLLKGQRNEHWGAEARRRVPCTIRGVLYDTGRGYPAFVQDDGGRDVAAELLEVTPETLARIDVLEGYPRLYVRETVPATLADGSVVQAMVYVMRKLPERARVIESGRFICKIRRLLETIENPIELSHRLQFLIHQKTKEKL